MDIERVLTILGRRYPTLNMQAVATTPFRTLISTIISQRARDEQSIPVSAALFRHADTPQTMFALSDPMLLTLLRPAGKYRQNAKRIKEICTVLLGSYEGRVPRDEPALLSLPGVGRKTANIVRSHAFAVDAIAVDTHVQRITNRLGWVNTATPPQTEATLKRIIPRKFWRSVNRVFVRHGQVICTPRSPFCSKCPVFRFCKRVGVRRSR